MALSFPLSPSIGQIYIAPNGVSYVWNGSYWAAESSGGGSGGGGGGGGSPITVLNEGTVISTSATVFNFTGTLIATSAENAVTINAIPQTTSTLINGAYSLVLGSDGTVNLPIATNGSGVIQTTGPYYLDANGAIFTLNVDGSMTFPDNSVQVTAWNTSTPVFASQIVGGVSISTATTATLGLVKIGSGISVTSSGTISVQPGLLHWQESISVINSTQTAIVSLIATSTQTNVDAVIQPQGAGANLGNINGNKRGQYATDWQKQIGNGSQVASGDYAVISGGSFNQASGLHSSIGGGNNNLANANYSTIVGGNGGSTRGITGAVVFPGFATGGVFSTPGVMQSAIYNIGAVTTNSTPVRLSTDGNPTPSANNQIGIGDRSTAYFKGTVIAKEDVTHNANIWAWTFQGVLRQDIGSTTTDFVPSGIPPAITTITNTTSAVTLTLDIDNVTGCMIVEATGAVSKTIRWSGKIETVEVTDNS